MIGIHNSTVPPSLLSNRSVKLSMPPSTFLHQNHVPIEEEVLSSSTTRSLLSSSQVQPTPSTVVIGKGKVPRKAPGNFRLRSLVQTKLDQYVNAKSKMVKSSIVTNIFVAIRDTSFIEGGPAFVRYDGRSYSVVTESAAREKITSLFRDSLHDQYKSSSKNKVAKRRIANRQLKVERERSRLRIISEVCSEIPAARHGANSMNSSSLPSLSGQRKLQEDKNTGMHPLKQFMLSSTALEQEEHFDQFMSSSTATQPDHIRSAPYYESQLFLSSSRMGIQPNTVYSSCFVPSPYPHPLPRVDMLVEPIVETLGPIDKSVFDIPFQDLNFSSTSRTSMEGGNMYQV